MTRAAIMRIKIARVEREGTERGRPFVVCFSDFYHPNPRMRVQDMLEPLLRKDKGKDQPTLELLEGYELVAGLNDSLDMTAVE